MHLSIVDTAAAAFEPSQATQVNTWPGMPPIRQTVEVTFHYPLYFTYGVFRRDNPLLNDALVPGGSADCPRKLLCVVDYQVTRHHRELLESIEAYCQRYGKFLELVCSPLVFEGGEQVKNDPAYVAAIQRAIHEFGLDRHSYLIVVGSGAILDMAGYAAATAHRGVRLVRVPTSVLSQADSGVGVKNGVNAFGKKNFLGAFAPPYAVLNDFDFLTSLPDREWRSGIAEAIKVALLKDAGFFEYLEQHAGQLARRHSQAMQWVIYRCAELHLQHIATSGDPFEMGSSRPLDFGHWAAHKLEQLSDYQLRHGEAVAIGLALDSTYSYLTGRLAVGDWQRILRLISALGLPVCSPELSLYLHDRRDARCVLNGLNEFREHLGGELTVMLLQLIGQGVEVHAIDEVTMIRSIAFLEEYQAARQQGECNGFSPRHVPAYAAPTRGRLLHGAPYANS